MRQGDIVLIIIYKKDPKEIRNYRPITLLNRDYKILTTILAGRLKNICEAAISKQQKGFVPGRQIIRCFLAAHMVDTMNFRVYALGSMNISVVAHSPRIPPGKQLNVPQPGFSPL